MELKPAFPTSMLDSLAEQNWAVAENFLDVGNAATAGSIDGQSEVARLKSIWSAHREQMHAATIRKSRELEPSIRGDSILWLDEANMGPTDPFIARLGRLRDELNENFFIGLSDFESHFAYYPPGAGYAAHYDQPMVNGRRESLRTMTMVLYLNSDWKPGDGGELVLWKDESRHEALARVEPRAGTAAFFRTEAIYHEVLAAHAPRLSVTTWFRKKAPGIHLK